MRTLVGLLGVATMSLPLGASNASASHSSGWAAPADPDVEKLATFMIGTFDTVQQAREDAANKTAYRHDVARMTVRHIQDPLAFYDAVYLYVENRLGDDPRPYRQRVYRLSRKDARVVVNVFRIDEALLPALAASAEMLTQLSESDLQPERGCEITLVRVGDVFEGGTGERTCRSNWRGSSYVTARVRITRDLSVTLDRGYDASGKQTFGPTDGRGYEFRRTASPPAPASQRQDTEAEKDVFLSVRTVTSSR
jgi:hypothetical protein